MRLMQRLVSELFESKGASGLMTGLTTIMGPHAWLCICSSQLDNILQLEKDVN